MKLKNSMMLNENYLPGEEEAVFCLEVKETFFSARG
jgi:hypothetical protein